MALKRFDIIHGEKALVRLYNLFNDPTRTYAQIGGEFGLSRQRVGQLARS